MAKIAWLSFSLDNPEKRYSGLVRLAATLGHEIWKPPFDHNDLLASAEAVVEAVETADAFMVPDPVDIAHPKIIQPLHKRIRDGHRAIFAVNYQSSSEEDNTLIDSVLAPFDMSPLEIKIRPPIGYQVVIEQTTTGFRESELLKGVDKVNLMQPNALYYWLDTTPVLIVDEKGIHGSVMPIDKGDLEMDRRTLQKLSPYVIWRDPDGPGTVLGIYGFTPFCDPYLPMSGRYDGIEANPVLARRMIEYLTNGISKSIPDLRGMWEQVEINLAETIKTICGRADNDWWNKFVPEKVKVKCEKQMEHDRHCGSKLATMTIIDMKLIIESNKDLFELVFDLAGFGPTKRDRLGWINRFNEARNVYAHPTKSHFDNPMPIEEVQSRFEEAVMCSRRIYKAAHS
jgi:hypothetical protein